MCTLFQHHTLRWVSASLYHCLRVPSKRLYSVGPEWWCSNRVLNLHAADPGQTAVSSLSQSPIWPLISEWHCPKCHWGWPKKHKNKNKHINKKKLYSGWALFRPKDTQGTVGLYFEGRSREEISSESRIKLRESQVQAMCSTMWNTFWPTNYTYIHTQIHIRRHKHLSCEFWNKIMFTFQAKLNSVKNSPFLIIKIILTSKSSVQIKYIESSCWFFFWAFPPLHFLLLPWLPSLHGKIIVHHTISSMFHVWLVLVNGMLVDLKIGDSHLCTASGVCLGFLKWLLAQGE